MKRRDLTQGQRAMIAAELGSYNLYDYGEAAKAAPIPSVG
jgi:hypothetical protein